MGDDIVSGSVTDWKLVLSKGQQKKTLTVNLFILFCRFLLSGINGGLTWVEKAVKILQIDVENYT